MQVVQQLNVRDYVQRVDFALRIQVIFEENENSINIMSEAHFYSNDTINKQNLRYWTPENPRKIYEKPLNSARVTVCCVVAPFSVIGLYLFEEVGVTVTVN
jgi:hypothetical protein